MREDYTRVKRINELSFSDLYIEEDEELYPNIKQAIEKLSTKLKRRKKTDTRKSDSDESFFAVHIRDIRPNHLRHTGI